MKLSKSNRKLITILIVPLIFELVVSLFQAAIVFVKNLPARFKSKSGKDEVDDADLNLPF